MRKSRSGDFRVVAAARVEGTVPGRALKRADERPRRGSQAERGTLLLWGPFAEGVALSPDAACFLRFTTLGHILCRQARLITNAIVESCIVAINFMLCNHTCFQCECLGIVDRGRQVAGNGVGNAKGRYVIETLHDCHH